jgi:hypothetical protein
MDCEQVLTSAVLHRTPTYANVPERKNETSSCVDRQQTLDARNQGSRPLALARLTDSNPA